MGTVLVAGNRDHGVAATQAPPTPPAIPSAIPSFPSTATSLRAAPIGPCVIVRAGFDCTAAGTYRSIPTSCPCRPRSTSLAAGSSGTWDRGPPVSWSTAGPTLPVAPAGGSSSRRSGGSAPIPVILPPASSATTPSTRPRRSSRRCSAGPGSRSARRSRSRSAATAVFSSRSPRRSGLGECPTAMVWETAAGSAVDGYPMAAQLTLRPAQFRILEIGGLGSLIIRTTDFPQESPFEDTQGVAANPTRHAADQPALQAILNSLRFAPNP